MKPIIALILIVFAGCSIPRGDRLFIENLSRQLSENNASFTLDVKPGSIIIHRSNPTIGMSGTAGPNGATVSSLTNLTMSLQYHVATPPPTMPNQQSTNPTPKANP